MNIAVAQSGGPTCAINASLVGVFKQAVKTPQIDAVFGSLNGIEGIINDQLIDLKLVIKTNEDMELLRQTPSTVLGSCRYKLPDVEEGGETYERILNCLEKHRIEAFFYIGGNDSMDTVFKLSEKFAEGNIKTIGIRHGEKMYETLLTNEECAKAVDMGDFYRVPADNRGLNYDKYFNKGDENRNPLTEFDSKNTKLLNVDEVKEKLLSLKYIRDELIM